MLHDQLSKNLKEGERLISVIRRDVLSSLGPALLAAMVVLGDFFLLSWLLAHRPWGMYAFLVILIIGTLLAIRVVVEWRLNALLVTNQRIIGVTQRGLFTRTVAEAMLENITDVKFSVRGVVQTMLRLGSIEVQTAGDNENLRLDGVRHPSDVQSMITSTLQKSQGRGIPLSAQELVAALGRMKDELGEERFHQALSAVDARDQTSRTSKPKSSETESTDE